MLAKALGAHSLASSRVATASLYAFLTSPPSPHFGTGCATRGAIVTKEIKAVIGDSQTEMRMILRHRHTTQKKAQHRHQPESLCSPQIASDRQNIGDIQQTLPRPDEREHRRLCQRLRSFSPETLWHSLLEWRGRRQGLVHRFIRRKLQLRRSIDFKEVCKYGVLR